MLGLQVARELVLSHSSPPVYKVQKVKIQCNTIQFEMEIHLLTFKKDDSTSANINEGKNFYIKKK